MTPQELKNSILQLAIQGKLVEQRPEEGTAEELYQQIQAEKQALIKAGKIKKEKPLPEIAEDEIPFDIPESWKWVRLGDCTTYAITKEKIISTEIKPDAWSLDLEDIERDTGRIVKYCKAGDRIITGDKVVFHEGQILYSKLRPYLKKILVAPKDGICSPELVPFCTFGGIDSHYIVSVLKTPHIDFTINIVTYGVKMPRVGTDTMVNLLIPLPPLAEQKRIVAKIEELLPLIERYEKAWTRLEEFNKRFPGDMQKSILQMAIQGKLVEQRPEEGTGEELYQQIQAEKKALLDNGEVYREKSIMSIDASETPFDIPDTWVWCRLGSLSRAITKGSSPAWQGVSYSDETEGILFVTSENVGNNEMLLSKKKYVERKFNEMHPSSMLWPGDILTNLVGASIGRTALFNENIYNANINQAVCLIRLVNNSISDFVLRYFMSETAIRFMLSGTVDTARANLSLTTVTNLLVPLPPLSEQKRIVARLEELLPLCEKLK